MNRGVVDRGARPRGTRLSGWEWLSAASVLTAVAVYVVGDDRVLDTLCYLGVLLAASAAAWVGAERAPEHARLVPRLIALGVSLSALGDVLWEVLDALGYSTDVSIADPAWFSSYVALCAAVWVVLVRSRPGGRADLGYLVDAATIVTVSILVFWQLGVRSVLAQDDLGTTAKLVASAYPVADAVLLALVARALLSPRARGSVGTAFAVGVVLWLLADTGPLLVPYEGAWALAVDSGWMLAPAFLALAAWRSRPGPAQEDDDASSRRWRLALLIAVAPLLVPPALEVVGDLRRDDAPPWALICGTVSLLALAMVRTARLLRSEERHVRELEAARDAALEASCAKSMFVATMSHELRTPLTTLIGTMEMLQETPLDAEQAFLLERMERAGVRLRSLVEDVLDFSVIEAGRLDIAARPFDLHRTLDDLLEVYTPITEGAGLRLEWHRDADVPADVVGDPLRLQQVLGNLLDNAVKFTPSGSVGIRVATLGADPGLETLVLFSVTDTGIGIPADRLAAVFESFTQVDGSPTRPYEGSGLGLTISRRLVQAMGGTLEVRSTPGEGSTFEVTVPLRSSGVVARG
ncbi:sensor histidine kinase [Nocardioides okcheonensis]|uniref:sensor histidine kinase n=1 Tax=Nocardioides okcheonensis TaxID=2894081 RepID=UPI001E4717D8|nr:ATP-binding protein [Nocardioides okcheonensis]UFN46785.1 hypothetical protein LN652_21760 [Nocardioides okcheonensis]